MSYLVVEPRLRHVQLPAALVDAEEPVVVARLNREEDLLALVVVHSFQRISYRCIVCVVHEMV